MKIKLENVKSVYSGRPGCMCGCRGKYWKPGTPGGDRMVKKIVGILNNDIKHVEVDRTRYHVKEDEVIYSLDVGPDHSGNYRSYVVYTSA